MGTFVVETYLSRHAIGEPEATAARLMTVGGLASGEQVRYVRTVFVPDDELCLLIFEAPSIEAVGAVLARAGLDPIRIAEGKATEGDDLHRERRRSIRRRDR